jgi:hypothetical protein
MSPVGRQQNAGREMLRGRCGGRGAWSDHAQHDPAAALPEERRREQRQDSGGPVLRFTQAAWTAFLTGAVNGEFAQE